MYVLQGHERRVRAGARASELGRAWVRELSLGKCHHTTSRLVYFPCRSFQAALTQPQVGFDEGHAVTVSAAHMDAILNGTAYRHDSQASFDAWVARHASLSVAPLRTLAVQALDRVLADSEAQELWSQTDQIGAWRLVISGLRGRLALDA